MKFKYYILFSFEILILFISEAKITLEKFYKNNRDLIGLKFFLLYLSLTIIFLIKLILMSSCKTCTTAFYITFYLFNFFRESLYIVFFIVIVAFFGLKLFDLFLNRLRLYIKSNVFLIFMLGYALVILIEN